MAMEKREIAQETKTGLSVQDLLLIGILLAAGAVLKFFVGSMFSIGMKPNFIIAMYCLAILLIRPGIKEAAIIGVIAGAVCQFFPGTPYINFVSEIAGAIVMAILLAITTKVSKISVISILVTTFISTAVSGFTYIGCLYMIFYMKASVTPAPLAVFVGIVFGTATINAIIDLVLYYPLKIALKK